MSNTIDLLELEVNIPADNFGEYCTCLSAPPKWGKTEWATKYEKPFILDFEEGSKGKVVLRISVAKWTEVKKYIRQLVKEPALKAKVQTVVFDTVNYALEACKQYVMDEYQLNHPDKIIDTFNKIPYGGGKELLNKEFKTEINKLKRSGYGIVLISHIKNKEFDKESESAHYKTVPDLTDAERNLISAMADFLLLGEFEIEVLEPAQLDSDGKIKKEAITKTNRVLYLRTNDQAEAGFRWGDCPEKIPADYDLFQKIFKEALLNEIEKGKEKYNLTDEKTNKIRTELDSIRQKEKEDIIKAEQEKDLMESQKEELQKVVTKIKDIAKQLRDGGIKVKDIKELIGHKGIPDNIPSLNEARIVLSNLEKLLV